MSSKNPVGIADKPVDPVTGPVIFSYTRADAIRDGNLIDVSDMAKEAGFRRAVALTAGAWLECVAWNGEDSRRQVAQDESGRLWDLLYMAAYAVRIARCRGDRLLFPLFRVPRDGHSTRTSEVSLKLVAGPGDQGEEVVTIMLPGED